MNEIAQINCAGIFQNSKTQTHGHKKRQLTAQKTRAGPVAPFFPTKAVFRQLSPEELLLRSESRGYLAKRRPGKPPAKTPNHNDVFMGACDSCENKTPQRPASTTARRTRLENERAFSEHLRELEISDFHLKQSSSTRRSSQSTSTKAFQFHVQTKNGRVFSTKPESGYVTDVSYTSNSDRTILGMLVASHAGSMSLSSNCTPRLFEPPKTRLHTPSRGPSRLITPAQTPLSMSKRSMPRTAGTPSQTPNVPRKHAPAVGHLSINPIQRIKPPRL
ncbi:hypothetical protein AAMO2058_001095500 [Amorphochlora amoebiformis]